MEPNKFDRKAHIEAIDMAMSELSHFQLRTTAPAPLPHQFIGTVVDNTVALLVTPANSLDGGMRSVRFSEINNWRSLIRSVHSSFLSQIHLATERGLIFICEEHNLSPQSSFQLSILNIIGQIENHIESTSPLQKPVRELRALAKHNRPQFDDYLNTVLSNRNLNKKTKNVWRKFFRGLSIVRNKISHSVTALTETERDRLKEGGFLALISDSGELVINPRMYAQIVGHILNFFDLVSPTNETSQHSEDVKSALDKLFTSQNGARPMSLIISVYVPAGIVISGDSRVIGTLLQQVPQPTERNPEAAITVQTQIKISDFASKIFLVYDKYGVGTFGDAIINNIPIAHHISLFQAQNSNIPQSVEHLAQALLQYFSASSPIPNVGFIVAGYKGIIPWVFGVNPQAQSIERVNITGETSQLNYGIVRGGDTAIVDRLLSQAQFNPLFDVMNLQDAVDYSRHLIRLTTEQMRFEPRVATVGGEIDTLILTPNEAKFLYCKELHCS